MMKPASPDEVKALLQQVTENVQALVDQGQISPQEAVDLLLNFVAHLSAHARDYQTRSDPQEE